jgi:hypothetical protein
MKTKYIRRPIRVDRSRLGMNAQSTMWSSPQVQSPSPTGWTYSSANYGMGHTAYNHVGDASSTVDAGIVSTSLWSAAGAAIGAYHGYKRNGSVGWAIVWGVLGAISPIITSAVAFAQGIDKRKSS